MTSNRLQLNKHPKPIILLLFVLLLALFLAACATPAAIEATAPTGTNTPTPQPTRTATPTPTVTPTNIPPVTAARPVFEKQSDGTYTTVSGEVFSTLQVSSIRNSYPVKQAEDLLNAWNVQVWSEAGEFQSGVDQLEFVYLFPLDDPTAEALVLQRVLGTDDGKMFTLPINPATGKGWDIKEVLKEWQAGKSLPEEFKPLSVFDHTDLGLVVANVGGRLVQVDSQGNVVEQINQRGQWETVSANQIASELGLFSDRTYSIQGPYIVDGATGLKVGKMENGKWSSWVKVLMERKEEPYDDRYFVGYKGTARNFSVNYIPAHEIGFNVEKVFLLKTDKDVGYWGTDTHSTQVMVIEASTLVAGKRENYNLFTGAGDSVDGAIISEDVKIYKQIDRDSLIEMLHPGGYIEVMTVFENTFEAVVAKDEPITNANYTTLISRFIKTQEDTLMVTGNQLINNTPIETEQIPWIAPYSIRLYP
jgi:hypothetical protein